MTSPRRRSGVRTLAASALVLAAPAALRAQATPVAPAARTAPGGTVHLDANVPAATVFYACYVPLSGTVYRIKTADTKPACASPSHVEFSWTDGAAGGGGGGGGTVGPDLDLAGHLTVGTTTALHAVTATAATVNGVLRVAEGDVLATHAVGITAIPTQGAGSRFMWWGGTAAVRAGYVDGSQWDQSNVGDASAAFGYNTKAGGSDAFAAGFATNATAMAATAFGSGSAAADEAAFAAGYQAHAYGPRSVALGNQTVAQQMGDVALGDRTTANSASTSTYGGAIALGTRSLAEGVGAVAGGDQASAKADGSVALGYKVTTQGAHTVVLGGYASSQYAGSFVFGDGAGANPANDLVRASADNEFTVRASGGIRFFSSAKAVTGSPGCSIAPGGGGWNCTSNRHAKTAFRALSGETVLARIRSMPVTSWRYKTESPTVRHIGPMAQDFAAAFALSADTLTINSSDAQGVALAAAKALDVRTRTLARENATLRARLDALEERLVRLAPPAVAER